MVWVEWDNDIVEDLRSDKKSTTYSIDSRKSKWRTQQALNMNRCMNILAVNFQNMNFVSVRGVHKTFITPLLMVSRFTAPDPSKIQRFSLHQHIYYALLKAIGNSWNRLYTSEFISWLYSSMIQRERNSTNELDESFCFRLTKKFLVNKFCMFMYFLYLTIIKELIEFWPLWNFFKYEWCSLF